MSRLRFRPLALAAAAAFAASTLCAQTPAARVEIADAAQPQLVAARDGRVWLAYGRYTESAAAPATAAAAPAAPADHAAHGAPAAHSHGDGKKKGHQPSTRTGELLISVSSDRGATFAAAQKVATLPKLMLGNRRGPRLAVHGDRLTVTAIADELVAFTSTDAGRTWTGPVTINDAPAAAREGLHDLAAAPDGSLFVTWLDLRNGKTELWGATSRDGGRTWARNELVYRSPDKSICECCHPSALFDANGHLAVMWRNSVGGARDMWLATRAPGAAQFSAARKLGEGTWKLNACPMDGGRPVALGRGEFGAVFQRGGEIFLARASGPETRLGTGKQPVALQPAAGDLLVAWQQGADLVSARGTSAATPRTHATDARFPSLVLLADGRTALLAYERGPAKGATTVAIERL